MATADGLYAAIAAFGLSALTSLLVGLDRVLGVVGGSVLILLAVRGLRSVRAGDSSEAAVDPEATIDPEATSRRATPATAFGTMVGLTLTNPATILSFTALFASLGAGTGGPAGAALVTVGVASGSALWWLLLTSIVAGLRTRLTPSAVRGLNVLASLVIGAFGVGAVVAGVAMTA